MRNAPIELQFGDKSFTIKPLTVRQVMDLEAILVSTESVPGVTMASKIVSLALKWNYPDEDLMELEGKASDLLRYSTDILVLGGYKEASSVGEA